MQGPAERTSKHACRYGCSKWASEVQLQQLHERWGVPVSIFRCGMILAHSRRACSLVNKLLINARMSHVFMFIF